MSQFGKYYNKNHIKYFNKHSISKYIYQKKVNIRGSQELLKKEVVTWKNRY